MAKTSKSKSKTVGEKPSTSTAAGALWRQYHDNPDRETLRVYADALAAEGNPRGAFINLCLIADPTDAQKTAKDAMLSKQKKAIAGPGGQFLREFEFGPDGLVSRARTEANNVIAGLDALTTLAPRLVLTITSIKTQKDAAAFGALDLGDIWFVDFGWITGTHGGMKLDDKQLAAVGPALANVRNLQLSLVGTADNCFTPDGLRGLGRHLRRIRYLSLALYSGGAGPAPAADYAAAIAETPGFATLRGVDLPGATRADFGGMNVVVNTGLVDAGGTLASSTWTKMRDDGREFADLLDAALA